MAGGLSSPCSEAAISLRTPPNSSTGPSRARPPRALPRARAKWQLANYRPGRYFVRSPTSRFGDEHRQRLLGVVLPLEMHRHADAYRLVVRRPELRDDARTILHLDQDHCVWDGECRMSLVMHNRVAIDLSPPG